jgi:hypothetical protein
MKSEFTVEEGRGGLTIVPFLRMDDDNVIMR